MQTLRSYYMRNSLSLILIFMSVGNIHCLAQDTLPNISIRSINTKNIISWKNTYGRNISNINIQRSADSLKNFTSIGSVLNPMNRENGFVDAKVPAGPVFYRVFVAFEGGSYIFSRTVKPKADSVTEITTIVKIPDEVLPEVSIPLLTVPSKPAVPVFVPSKFVFTNPDFNVIINLPDAATRKFSVKFFNDMGKMVFDVNKIDEPYLIIEKMNFVHAGWFDYQLFDNGILLEKYKVYISKDGKGGIPPMPTEKSN